MRQTRQLDPKLTFAKAFQKWEAEQDAIPAEPEPTQEPEPAKRSTPAKKKEGE